MKPEQTTHDCYLEHRERLVAFCFRVVGNRETAEDLAQDAFLKSVELGKKELPWLFTCARNLCIDHLRRKGGWQRVAETLRRSLSWIPGFEKRWVERDTGLEILRGLNPKERSLLLLKVHAGFSYQELADLFDTSPEAVGVQLSRARKKVRERWKKESQA
jgi:RNA polymerase sigma-70 factor, ECF subfamily